MEEKNSLLDLSFLRSFTNNNEEKSRYYIEVYIRTATQLFGEIERKLEELPYDELYSRVHSLKPQTRYVGIKGLSKSLTEIEQDIKANADRDSVRKKLEEVIELNKRGIEELASYLSASN